MSEIPTTTATFRAFKSLPLPWIVATLMAGGGGFAGRSILGGSDQQTAIAAAAANTQIIQKLDLLLEKIEDLDDRADDIERAIAVSEARHGRALDGP